MSAVNFTYDNTQAFIACDSLVVTEGSEITAHTSKAWSLPNLGMVVASLGSCAVTRLWVNELMIRWKRSDIADINNIAPWSLESHWQSVGRGIPTWIIHFGFEASTGELAVYQYASDCGFKSQRYPAWGTYLIPHVSKHTELAPELDAEPIQLEPSDKPQTERSNPPPIPHLVDLSEWPYRKQNCVTALSEQRLRNPGRVGGDVFCTLITAREIRQYSMGEIPNE